MEIGCETTTLDMMLDIIEKALPQLDQTKQVEYMTKYQELYKEKYEVKHNNYEVLSDDS